MEGLLNLQYMLRDGVAYIWLLNNLIFEILFSYIDISLFTQIFSVKINNLNKIKFIIASSLLNLISKLFIISPYVRIINMFTTILLFKVFLKNSTEKCILGAVLNIMTIICSEVLFSKIFCLLYEDIEDYASGFYNLKYAFSLMFAILIVRLLILFTIKHKKVILDLKENLSYENKYTIISVSIISFLLIFLNILQINGYDSNFSYAIFVINTISLIIYFCVSLKSFIKIAILEEQYDKIHTLESYNKTLSIMYDNIRGFKHDFTNFVQALDGYVKTNNIDGIRTMSQGILKDCISTNNLEILDPDIINNSAVYSIITNKYYLAQEQDIIMNIEVMIDLNDINISNYELCRILAILLDNAIEAASKCKEKRIINLKLLKDLNINRKLIIVENSYVDSNIDIDKILKKDLVLN